MALITALFHRVEAHEKDALFAGDQMGVETFAVAMAFQGVELSNSFVPPVGD